MTIRNKIYSNTSGPFFWVSFFQLTNIYSSPENIFALTQTKLLRHWLDDILPSIYSSITLDARATSKLIFGSEVHIEAQLWKAFRGSRLTCHVFHQAHSTDIGGRWCCKWKSKCKCFSCKVSIVFSEKYGTCSITIYRKLHIEEVMGMINLSSVSCCRIQGGKKSLNISSTNNVWKVWIVWFLSMTLLRVKRWGVTANLKTEGT